MISRIRHRKFPLISKTGKRPTKKAEENQQPNGSKNVAWGDWRHFLIYAATLNWYLPASLQTPAAIAATVAETVFGLALIAGLYLRTAAYGSACLLTLFALSMIFARGIKAPLDFSVFVDVAAALLLAVTIPPKRTKS